MESTVVANLGIAQAVVASLGTVMVVGLGFLQRPSRSSLLWSLAFILAMVSTWASLAGESIGDESARRAGLGLMLGAPALIWSGFRARRSQRAYPWIAPVQGVISAAALVALTDPALYSIGFRALFFVASIFGALTWLEIRRSPDRHERLVLPLSLVSACFGVLGFFVLISGLLLPADDDNDLSLVRMLNAVSMLVYLVCATVTLLYFTSVSPVGRTTARSWAQFTVTVTDRLRRAHARGENSWVMLMVQLDDPADIRTAAGEASFDRVVARFEQTVLDAFPAEADIGRRSRGRLVVVLARPGAVIRQHVRELLNDVTEMDAAQQLAVKLSASVGWAPVDVVGWDFEALVSAADAASNEASQRGGDRWQRIGA
ncbi:diguanylate cyclase domain-containing protein [Microbacterium sp. P04]|uniref:diguanylate cyclase domain-containing protein n=1 Tax=Microbacterium sp. P04 TaxID=3366947 RepID=UPI003746EFF5